MKRFGFHHHEQHCGRPSTARCEHHMKRRSRSRFAFAIPDHPWVDSADGAAVRVAMTVGATGKQWDVIAEGGRKEVESQAGNDAADVVRFHKRSRKDLRGPQHWRRCCQSSATLPPMQALRNQGREAIRVLGSFVNRRGKRNLAIGLEEVPEQTHSHYRDGSFPAHVKRRHS